jgi:hypothetical protein
MMSQVPELVIISIQLGDSFWQLKMTWMLFDLKKVSAARGRPFTVHSSQFGFATPMRGNNWA